MEVVADGVVDEALLRLGLAARLVPAGNRGQQQMSEELRATRSPDSGSMPHFCAKQGRPANMRQSSWSGGPHLNTTSSSHLRLSAKLGSAQQNNAGQRQVSA